MKRLSIIFLLLISISFISAIPNDMTIQIKVSEDFETPVNYNISLNFTIYDSYTEGNILWNDRYYTKPNNGLATVTLQDVNLNFSNNYYLGVKIGNDEEAIPRTNITTNPYAFKSNDTDYFNGYTPVTLRNWIQNAFDSVYCKLTGCDIAGDINASGDIFASSFIGNGSLLSGVIKKESDPLWTSNFTLYNTSWSLDTDTTYSHLSNFTDDIDAENLWNKNDSDIYYNSGNVGIGTTTPSEKLDVDGNIQATGYISGKKSGVFGYLTTPDTETITTANTYQPLGLALTLAPIEDFEPVSATKIKYIGTKTQYFKVDMHTSFSSNTATATAHIADKKNNILIPGSEVGTLLKFVNEEQSMSGVFIMKLATNDEIEFVVKSDGTDVLTFEHFTASIGRFYV